MKKLTCFSILFAILFFSNPGFGVDGNGTAGETSSSVQPVLPEGSESKSDSTNNSSVSSESGLPIEIYWALYGGLYIIISIAFLYFGKQLFDFVTPFDLDTQITEKDNRAMGVVLTGYLLAIIVVVCGVMSSGGGESGVGVGADFNFTEFLIELAPVGLYTLAGIGFLLISGYINDKAILREFSCTQEVTEQKNVAVAIIIAAGFLGSALVIAGSIQGSLDWVSAAIGFCVGQLLLVVFAMVYQRATAYDDQQELHQRKNVAVGLAFGGNLLAYSILIMKGLTMSGGGLETIADRLSHFGYYAIIGAVVLPLLRIANDRLFLPGVSLDDEIVKDQNVNAGLMEAGLAVSMAVILIVCL